MTNPDFRALCKELHAAFNTYAVDMAHHDLLERARTALAQPEPVAPTDEELGHTRQQHRRNPLMTDYQTTLLFGIAIIALVAWGTK